MTKTRTIGGVLALMLIAGCRIPDLKPFSDATTAMVTGLKQGFERSRASLTAAAETADDQAAFAAELKKLDAAWKPTREALSALVVYSDSLAALAEAGKTGPETMARLTDAINDLATSVSLIPIPAAGVQVVNQVGAKIIEIKAAGDIRKAVDAASGAIDIIAPVLKATFVDLRSIHDAAAKTYATRVEAESSILTNYYGSLQMEEQRLEYLLNLIIDYQSAPARLRWRAALARAENRKELAEKLIASIPQEQRELLGRLKESDTVFQDMELATDDAATTVETRQLQLIGMLGTHRKELALLDPRYNGARNREAALRNAWRTGDLVLATGGEAIDAWLKAHKSLRATAEGKQSRPSVSDLVSLTQEMTALIN